LFPGVQFGPHWDALDTYVPGLQAMFAAAVPVDQILVAIDENTALVGDGSNWQVIGVGAASIRRGGEWRTFRSGRSFTEPLLVALDAVPAQT
jgi:cyanophycinase-like exopeptidase